MTILEKKIPAPHRMASIVVLFLGSAALYANTLWNGFVYDDRYQILNNPWIRDFGRIRDIFTQHVWAFAGKESSYYRPFMHIAYATLYVPFGPAAWAFHLLNVLLHGAATLLVFMIGLRILPAEPVKDTPGILTGPLAAGLLFAAHPIHTEAVAWIGSLPDMASAVLCLAGILMFLKASDCDERHIVFHVMGSAAYLSAALFKESGLTLPAVILLVDLVLRPKVWKTAFWASRYGFLVLAGVAYVALRYSALGALLPAVSGRPFDPLLLVGNMGSALWKYFAMLVAPFRLNAYHTLESATGLPPFVALMGFPLILGAAVWRKSQPLTFASAMFLLPLVPAVFAPALLPGLDNPWAERYVYLSSAGFAIAVGSLFDGGIRRGPQMRRIATGALAVILIASSIATILRNQVWKDERTLWTDAVNKSPNAWAPRSYLGYALFMNGDVDGAIRQYGIAIGMKPAFGDAHANLGVALAVLGDHRSAAAAYFEAIRLGPQNAQVHANLSVSLSALGYAGEALREADRAVELDPFSAKAHAARGVALGNGGRIAEALESFRRAIEIDPGDASSRSNMEKAVRFLKKY